MYNKPAFSKNVVVLRDKSCPSQLAHLCSPRNKHFLPVCIGVHFEHQCKKWMQKLHFSLNVGNVKGPSVGKGPCSHDMSGLVWIPAKARHCLTQLVIITPYGNHSEWSYYPIWGYLPSTRNRDFRPLGRYPESGFPTTRKIPRIGISNH